MYVGGGACIAIRAIRNRRREIYYKRGSIYKPIWLTRRRIYNWAFFISVYPALVEGLEVTLLLLTSTSFIPGTSLKCVCLIIIAARIIVMTMQKRLRDLSRK